MLRSAVTAAARSASAQAVSTGCLEVQINIYLWLILALCYDTFGWISESHTESEMNHQRVRVFCGF